jgi:uncharacterized membrane protein YgdD (TMEM256/DUF423 family)
MVRNILLWGIVMAMLSVLFGAFGAHALKTILRPDQLQIFETGVRYQMMHALALIGFALYANTRSALGVEQKQIRRVAGLFKVGIFLFSGSLYGLVLLANSTIGLSRILGPITPIGGLCFMLGWAAWARMVFVHKVDK